MIFRLGYVAMTLNLFDCSPSSTVTATAFEKLPTEEARKYRLRKLTRKNLENTLRILRYNKACGIQVYRFTSKLVPLATHPAVDHWNYVEEFAAEFRAIGDFVKENDFRVSAHPDHYTLINSPSQKVLQDAVRDLDYHVRLYEAMGLDDYRYKLVMHVGGMYQNKEASLERFKENFVRLPDRIRRRIILENDDKSYTARDVLQLCRDLEVPMVLDVHHHHCVNNGESLQEMLPGIFDTWRSETFKPKIHFSSPKSPKDFRSHAEDINPEEFTAFLQLAVGFDVDFDVMLEAKNKDNALLKLADQLQGISGISRTGPALFQMTGGRPDEEGAEG